MEAYGEFESKMKARGLSKPAMDAFRQNYEQLVGGATGMVPEAEIDAISDLPRFDSLETQNVDLQTLLSQTAVLKLNGGLGTSMGLEKAKSLLEVKDGKTFLDLIAEQVKSMRTKFGSNIRFILMNSFSTSDDTFAHLRAHHADLANEPHLELLQNMSPKVDAQSMKPASYPENPDMEWCPPGHGDIYPSLLGSGMMDQLMQDGIRYLFVSNSDNLGATLDVKLLSWFAASNKAFVMEVCERTAADKKGGHLCRRKSDGKFMLRESAMCPDADMPHFENIGVHKFFNTNNLWVNLEKLRDTLKASNGVLKLPLIKNKKTVNPRDSSTPKVFQLETAMGSAIECFDDAGAVVVPRERFAPVKTCNDLFVLRSDVYTITPESTVVATVPKVPMVKLDDAHYKLVDKMQALVDGYPSMKACESLKVTGAIKFSKGVALQGIVQLKNDGKQPAVLPAGEYAGSNLDLTPQEAAVPAGQPAVAMV